jgi:methionyl-tRNA formyltransferase
MKIILLSNSICSIPALQFLGNQQMVKAVVSSPVITPGSLQVEQCAKFLNIPFHHFLKKQLLTGFKDLLTELQPDLCLVFGYGFKIPAGLFTIPKFGFYNVHFSLLPAYRGHSPVFWQLKNGETEGGITIHKIAQDFDTGPILIQKKTSIFLGESYGLYQGKLAMESVPLISEALDKIEHLPDEVLTDQDGIVSFAPSVSVKDLKIDWQTQTAAQIESLVNATNPDYGGAVTLFRGQPLRILEVNSAGLANPAEFAPGTIVHADTNYGIFVACINMQFLRINVVQANEGILSGFKFASFGVAAGEKFENASDLPGVKVRV